MSFVLPGLINSFLNIRFLILASLMVLLPGVASAQEQLRIVKVQQPAWYRHLNRRFNHHPEFDILLKTGSHAQPSGRCRRYYTYNNPHWLDKLRYRSVRRYPPELQHMLRANSHRQWSGKINANYGKTYLQETQLLLQNDNLFPGQSRTQAMALESETGHLTPEEDSVLMPMLRKRGGAVQLRRSR
jgi:hypothetical protein